MNHHKQGVCSKNAPCLTRPARARQDVPFLKQGRRGFGARIVHGVREGERREERQACEREADKGPTCLREAAPSKAGNAAGGLFKRPII